METNYNSDDYEKDYYMPMLEMAAEFQDFVMSELHKIGIVLQNTTSKKYQLKKENMLGLEIKNDMKLEKTGNICIETSEKANPKNANYVPSGIYRDDNAWLYGIGNYKEFFIFSKKTLCLIDKQKIYLRTYQTPTSTGFLIKKDKGIHWAEKYIEWE